MASAIKRRSIIGHEDADRRDFTVSGCDGTLRIRERGERAIAYWLLLCCAMIFLMVVIGGITRLTLSGLSITEWQPVTGILPPLSEAAWAAEFEKYRQIPQYRLLNSGMSLGRVQDDLRWEYVHRLWGRLIGIVYAVPLLYFLLRRRIPRALTWPLAGIFAARFRAGRARLVHGQERPRRPGRRQPIPTGGASRFGAGDLRC